MPDALDIIINLTDGHPIDPDRRDRIHELALQAKNLVNETGIPKGISGQIQTFYQITCAVCHQSEVGTATHRDKFIQDMYDKKKHGWKLDSARGFVHKSCLRTMPNILKF
jgi:hypothetical protein